MKRRRRDIELAVEKGLQPGRKSLKTGNRFNFFTGLPQIDGREIPLSDEDGELIDNEGSISESMAAESTEWIVHEKPIPGNPDKTPVGVKVSLIEHVKRHIQDDREDDFDDEEQFEDGVDDTEKAVKILTRLLSETSEREKDEKLISNCSNDDLDREIKELKLKQLKIEIQDFEEKKIAREAKHRERVLDMKEQKERIKYYQNINQGFERVIKAADIIISFGNQGRNLLEEAFNETISSNCHEK